MAHRAPRNGLFRDIRGATLIEYTVLIGLLSAGAIVGLQPAMVWIEDQWDQVGDATRAISDKPDPSQPPPADHPSGGDGPSAAGGSDSGDSSGGSSAGGDSQGGSDCNLPGQSRGRSCDAPGRNKG